jgi:hypothetical protein
MYPSCRPVNEWVGCFKEGVAKDNIVLSNVCNQESVLFDVVFMVNR